MKTSDEYALLFSFFIGSYQCGIYAYPPVDRIRVGSYCREYDMQWNHRCWGNSKKIHNIVSRIHRLKKNQLIFYELFGTYQPIRNSWIGQLLRLVHKKILSLFVSRKFVNWWNDASMMISRKKIDYDELIRSNYESSFNQYLLWFFSPGQN